MISHEDSRFLEHNPRDCSIVIFSERPINIREIKFRNYIIHGNARKQSANLEIQNRVGMLGYSEKEIYLYCSLLSEILLGNY